MAKTLLPADISLFTSPSTRNLKSLSFVDSTHSASLQSMGAMSISYTSPSFLNAAFPSDFKRLPSSMIKHTVHAAFRCKLPVLLNPVALSRFVSSFVVVEGGCMFTKSDHFFGENLGTKIFWWGGGEVGVGMGVGVVAQTEDYNKLNLNKKKVAIPVLWCYSFFVLLPP